MQFNVFDQAVMPAWGATIGSDFTQGNCTIVRYTGNSRIGNGLAAATGTVTIVNAANGDVDYSNYNATEACETIWLEFEFSCLGCGCLVTTYIPVHPTTLEGSPCLGPMAVEPCVSWEAPCPPSTCVGGPDCGLSPDYNLDYADNLFNGGSTQQQQDILDLLTLYQTGTLDYATQCTFAGTFTHPTNGYKLELVWDWNISPGPAGHVKIRGPQTNLIVEINFLGTYTRPYDCDSFCKYRIPMVAANDINSNLIANESMHFEMFASETLC